MLRLTLIFLLLSLLLFKEVAAEAQSPITLAEVREIALSQNPQLFALKHRYQAARHRYQGSGLLPNPGITLSSGQDNAPEDANEISQRIPLPAKLWSEKQAARNEMEAAFLAWEIAKAELAAQAGAAFFQWEKAQKLSAVVDQNLKFATQMREAAEKRHRLGDIPTYELMKAQVEETRAGQKLAQAQLNFSKSKAMLNRLMGYPPDIPLTFTEAQIPLDLQVPNLETLKKLALENRPEIHLAKAGVSLAHSRIEQARNQYLPDLKFSAYRSQLKPEAESGTLLSLSFPLFDWGNIRNQVAYEQELVAAAGKQEDEIKNQALLEVEINYRELVQNQVRLKSFSREILSSSEKMVSMAQKAYSAGLNSYLEVLEAQRSFRDIQIEYYEIMAEYRTALTNLERAVGIKLFSAKEQNQ